MDRDSGAIVLAALRELVEDVGKREFDGFDCGPVDLGVLHLAFRGNVRLFEFVDYIVAKRFDLPARFFAVEYRERQKRLFECEVKAADAADEVLHTVCSIPRHSVISRSKWLEARAADQRLKEHHHILTVDAASKAFVQTGATKLAGGSDNQTSR
jgi:hypothetical protein